MSGIRRKEINGGKEGNNDTPITKKINVRLIVAHDTCPKKGDIPATMGRGRPVMELFAMDPGKQLNYYKCPLCGDTVGIRIRCEDAGE